MRRRERVPAWERRILKRQAVNAAEASGQIADSMEVRMDLIKRCEAGEITPDEMQLELAKIKRNAKRNGLITRDQAYNRG